MTAILVKKGESCINIIKTSANYAVVFVYFVEKNRTFVLKKVDKDEKEWYTIVRL